MSDEDKQGEQPPPEPVAQEGNDDKGAEGQGEQPKGQEIEGANADQNAENGSDVEGGVKSEGDAQQSMEETPQGGGKKKKRRLVCKTKKKTPFSLNSNINLMPTEYNALKDSHLQSFFVNDRVRKHLRKMYLITGEGYIVEKPEEYRRNRQLLRQHYASQSVGAVSKKGKKDSMPYGDAQTGSTLKKVIFLLFSVLTLTLESQESQRQRQRPSRDEPRPRAKA
jgi:hypothetical protein